MTDTIYREKKGHLTDDDLNKLHPNKAQSRKTLQAAKSYSIKSGMRRITKLIDYELSDILTIYDNEDRPIGTKIKDGAKPVTRGWLVSD